MESMQRVRVAKWKGAGFLSQQPGFDSRPGTYHKKRNIKATQCAFNSDYRSRKAYLKIIKKKNQSKVDIDKSDLF